MAVQVHPAAQVNKLYFTCDNVSSWNGNEMGFVRTLNDNVLKAYLQGGGQYIYTTVGGSGMHAYKCSRQRPAKG